MTSRPQLTLYSRQHCHLCELMHAQVDAVLAGLPDEMRCTLEVLDVDKSSELTARFNELVPVLMAGDRELAHYRLDEDALRDYLHSQTRATASQTR